MSTPYRKPATPQGEDPLTHRYPKREAFPGRYADGVHVFDKCREHYKFTWWEHETPTGPMWLVRVRIETPRETVWVTSKVSLEHTMNLAVVQLDSKLGKPYKT